jgi:cytochrome c oxidase accessory protein FixG
MAAPRKIIPITDARTAEDDSAQFVSMYQKQATIYPRAVKGWFATWRWVFVWLTQLLFYGVPWLQWSGRQAVLFDLEAQRFYIFGLLLYPQDLIFLAALLVLSALALFFFTAVAGRLWCGYTCPQTVYTEIFMWAERKIEGDRIARMRLDQAPWGPNKILRKGAKQGVWLAIALATGFSFVGYFTPVRELAAAAAAWDLSAWNAFWVLFYGAATYGNAGFLREQMCTYMCPYARFQSALIDKDSLVIAYDAGRGDPRGSRSKKANPSAQGLGDCIDCTLCVQVCPTGIDIRNGLQNECIGCAACIDVCNDVMDKMGYAKGLIRYSTENGVVNGWTRLQMFRRALRPRVLVYGAVLEAASLRRDSFVGAAVADVIQPLEGRDDLLVVRHHDDRRVVLQGHLVEDAHHGQRPLAVQRCGGLVGQDHRGPVRQRPRDRHALLFAARQFRRLRLARWSTSRAVSSSRARSRASAFGRPASIGSRATLSVTSRKGIR